jgi:acetyl-CoA carboxylase biotin carboxyl carrier protein
MKSEDIKELKELIEFLKENKIGELDLERGDLKVRIKFVQEGSSPDMATVVRLLTAQGHSAAPAPVVLPEVYAAPAGHAPAAAQPASTATPDEDPSLHIVKSPIVGTFYESPSPGSPAFIKIGDQVENGQVLCIIEAMKLMNEIEAECAGTVTETFAQNGKSVEYGQKLFRIKKA